MSWTKGERYLIYPIFFSKLLMVGVPTDLPATRCQPLFHNPRGIHRDWSGSGPPQLARWQKKKKKTTLPTSIGKVEIITEITSHLLEERRPASDTLVDCRTQSNHSNSEYSSPGRLFCLPCDRWVAASELSLYILHTPMKSWLDESQYWFPLPACSHLKLH